MRTAVSSIQGLLPVGGGACGGTDGLSRGIGLGTAFVGGVLGQGVHVALAEEVQGIHGQALDGDLKVEVRLVGHLHHGGITHASDLVALLYGRPCGDAVGQILGQVLVDGNGLVLMGDGHAGTHHGVLPDLLYPAVCGGVDGSLGGGGDVHAQVDAVVTHGVGVDLEGGVVALEEEAAHGEGHHGLGLLGAVQGRPNTIARGVNAELDELRDIQANGKEHLLRIQQREIESTGIQSLKIGYNNVFGYYLEVRNTYKEQVPETWIRKQTLVNAERYITQELKEYEDKILNAEGQIQIIETRLYTELMLALTEYVSQMQMNANVIAQMDCLMGFARVAVENKYVCPAINDSLVIDIRQGRHPVIEKQLPLDEEYVPNDVLLDNNGQQIIIITGPNMAGKSALLRQTALIVLMAQMGSFVPAESASIGVVDKIFTRVGASDNISLGESTFMVEMNEAASILNNLSERSLVLFDELGRGTSTYDGISIAWAIVEYIHEQKGHAKTLFATHYHELNEMEESFQRIRNYNVSVREANGKVIFMRKLVRGGSEHSFGIHVAKLAGMPSSIIQRANQILKDLENDHSQSPIASSPTIGSGKASVSAPSGMQLSFFQLDDPVLEQIRDEVKTLDINNLTPLEALNKLSEIKKLVGGK